MRTLQLTLLALALCAAGCATNSTTLLERDLRMQEDKIYQLQAMLDDSCAARESTIRENEALKRELAGGDPGPGSDRDRDRDRRGSPGRGGDLVPPTVELPGSSSDDDPSRSRGRGKSPKLEAPTIELPEPSDSPGVEMDPGDASTVLERRPTQLVINKRLTGGLDRDGHDGDEGLLVVFEPRDAAGHLVRFPGTVSVVVMDPAQEGAAARVARWDFAANEVTSHFQNTVLGKGLQFELPWPSDPPKNRQLQLFVRFTTEDGKKLTAETSIEIRPPSDMPGVDRQTQSNSSTPSAARPPRSRAPSSRIKTRSSKAEPPRGLSAPRHTDSAAAEPEEDGDEEAVEEQPVRQASRPDRPEWKPYR